jgi:hypothetical protein
MSDCNYKVIAELKPDLSDDDRLFINEKIDVLKSKMHIINVDNNTFCMEQPKREYEDFAPVGFFFVELEEFKNYFSKLEYYNLWRGEVEVAV